jgi:hypothetical protein
MSIIKSCFFILIAISSNQLLAEPIEDHFYLDGVYLFNVVSRADTTDFDFNEANGFAAFAGYRFNSYFSVELGGIAFEPIKSLESRADSAIHTEYDVTGYMLGVRGEAPLGDLFSVWAGVGLFDWESTFNYEIDYPNFPAVHRTGSNSNSGEDYYLRLGLTHPLSESFHITLEATQIELNDFFNTDQANTDLRQDYIGIGVGVHF